MLLSKPSATEITPWFMSMIAVRRAQLSDAGAISRLSSAVQQLHNEALPNVFKPPSQNFFSAEKLAALLKDTDSNMVAVAESEGEIVGYIYGAVQRRAEDEFRQAESTMYVQEIGVREDARRQGIGLALLAFMQQHAVSSGFSGMQVDYWAFNTRARGFFEACGFSPAQVRMRMTLKT